MTFARHSFTVQSDNGDLIPSVTLEVREEQLGLPLAAIYSDRDGTIPMANPVVIAQDSDGIFFHAAGGAYRITVTTVEGTLTRSYVGVGTAQENDWPLFGLLSLANDASDVGVTPAGTISSTNVQAALEELDTDIQGKEPADATIIKEADVQNSIVVSSGKLQLSGDAAAPGNSKVYGTDSGGTKGWVTPVAASWVTLASGAASGADLSIVLSSFTAYKILKLFLYSFVPTTDADDLWFRVSTNGGSSYDATGYRYAGTGVRDGNGTASIVSSSANQIPIASYDATRGPSNVAGEGGVDCELTLFDLATSRWNGVQWVSSWTGANQEIVRTSGAGRRSAAQDTDAIRVLFATNTIASGGYLLAGLQ